MQEKPNIVITRSRRPEPAVRNFAFTADMLPADGALKDYRQHAWETYSRLAMPSVTEWAIVNEETIAKIDRSDPQTTSIPNRNSR